jgi:multidrug resistance efflux pump
VCIVPSSRHREIFERQEAILKHRAETIQQQESRIRELEYDLENLRSSLKGMVPRDELQNAMEHAATENQKERDIMKNKYESRIASMQGDLDAARSDVVRIREANRTLGDKDKLVKSLVRSAIIVF